MMHSLEQFNCQVRGTRLALCQTNPSKKAVILLHANSASHKTWTHQLRSPVFKNYNLIAIDFPGCGNSQRSPNPDEDYTIAGLAELINAVMDQLGIKRHIVVGHSLGGHVALQLCKLRSGSEAVMIFGTPPLKVPPNAAEAFLPYEHIGLLFQPELSPQQAARLQSGLTFKQGAYPVAEDLLATDPNFRACMGKSLREVRGLSDETEILESLRVPVAILHGKADPVINLSYLKTMNTCHLWKGSVITREECGHYPQLEEPEWFNRQLLNFLEDLN